MKKSIKQLLVLALVIISLSLCSLGCSKGAKFLCNDCSSTIENSHFPKCSKWSNTDFAKANYKWSILNPHIGASESETDSNIAIPLTYKKYVSKKTSLLILPCEKVAWGDKIEFNFSSVELYSNVSFVDDNNFSYENRLSINDKGMNYTFSEIGKTYVIRYFWKSVVNNRYKHNTVTYTMYCVE